MQNDEQANQGQSDQVAGTDATAAPQTASQDQAAAAASGGESVATPADAAGAAPAGG